MSNKPVVFITNDDGYFAKGINALVDVVSQYAKVFVVAPDQSRSGYSCAFTSKAPLRMTKLSEQDDLVIYSTNGTPTDCAKLAFFDLFAKEKPDLVLSGINHGSNASVNAIYSGTVGGAIEGCVNHVPSVAFSLCDLEKDADFSYCLPWVDRVVRYVLKSQLPQGSFLNVNFPKGELKGCRVCRQADAYWSEEFDRRVGADGSEEFFLTGRFINREPDSVETDLWALDHGYASIVPVKINSADDSLMDKLNNELIGNI